MIFDIGVTSETYLLKTENCIHGANIFQHFPKELKYVFVWENLDFITQKEQIMLETKSKPFKLVGLPDIKIPS